MKLITVFGKLETVSEIIILGARKGMNDKMSAIVNTFYNDLSVKSSGLQVIETNSCLLK